MERLTFFRDGIPTALMIGEHLFITEPPECVNGLYVNSGIHYMQGRIVEELAKYEDTGLSAEEIKRIVGVFIQMFGKDVSAVRIQELIRADREERLLVLPCAIGTPVYVHEALCDVGGHATFMDCKYSQDCRRDRFIKCPLRVVKRAFTEKMRKGLGRTFWLTKEEAEAAIPADRRP